MASNITPSQPQQPNNQPDLVRDSSSTAPQLWNRAKIIKASVTTLLIALALGTAIAGTTLSVVFAAPIFLAFILASVLFAIAAYTTHKLLAPSTPVQFDWTKKLHDQFRSIPEKAIPPHFIAPYQYGSFYQNKLQPSITVVIPRNNHDPYATLFPVVYREDVDVGSVNYNGIIVNAVDPDTQNVLASSTSLSKAIHRFLVAYPQGEEEWLNGKQRPLSGTNIAQPFLPEEVRLTPITTRNFATKHKKDRHPSYLLHVRGPSMHEFHGSQNSATRRYYLEAKESYKYVLNEAASVQSTILLLPLFSSVYDNTNTVGINPTTINDLCMSALLDAINEFAQTNQAPRKMLIMLQPRNATESN